MNEYKADRREAKRVKAKNAPKVVRYGIWTGAGHLREAQNLTNIQAKASVKGGK